jgi:hypothetical protein
MFSPKFKHFALAALTITVGVLGALQLNQLINRAKTVPPATSTGK